jgi:hypothetical protein
MMIKDLESGAADRHNLVCLVVVFLYAAILVSATQAFAAAGYDRSGPWWKKVPRPLFGMAYTPEPSDYNNTAPEGDPKRTSCPQPAMCKYFDTDFANKDFSALWGPSGRNDLGTIRTRLKMNFIALYDWVGGFCRDHTPFLDAAWNGGTKPLMVTIPISNYNVATAFDPLTVSNIRSILYQAYGLNASGAGTPKINPAVSMWRIGNEVQRNGIPPANAAEVAKIIVNFEKDKRIPVDQQLVFTSDADFVLLDGKPAGIARLLALKAAFINAGLSDIWYKRYIASFNTINDASFIDNYVKSVFPAQDDFKQGKGLSLFFTEYGQNSKEACDYIKKTTDPTLNCNLLADQNKAQAQYNKAEFQVGSALAKTAITSGTGYFYGFAVFQWQDAFWKCPAEYSSGMRCTQSLFGIQTVGAKTMDGQIPGGACGLRPATYPVNKLDPKPVFNEIPGALGVK